MKFALFLICALAAIQGFQAHSVQPIVERDLGDIIETIKGVINKLKEIIGNIASQIPDIIQNIKDKIKDIVNNIPNIINDIKKKIQETIELAGDIGRKCVDTQRENFEALIQYTQEGIQGCVAEAEGKTEDLKTQLNVLISKLQNLRDDVVSRTLKCVEDNKMNPINLVNCLRDQVQPINDDIVDVQKEVMNTIDVAKKIAQEAGGALVACSNKVRQEVANKEMEIIETIQQCIAEST